MKDKHQKGLFLEKRYSRQYHQNKLPLLVSPLFLRSIGAGQIDIAFFYKRGNKKLIKVVELKSSTFLSRKQRLRLNKTLRMLGEVFDMPIEFELEIAKCEKLF